MRAAELRKKAETDLGDLLLELRREQFSLRMQQGTGQVARPGRIRELRRTIARIKTVMNEQKTGRAS